MHRRSCPATRSSGASRPSARPSKDGAGDRAGVAWLAGADGTCDKCRSGRENLCARATFTGWDVDGGYATHAAVRADFALRLPERVRRSGRGAAAVRRRDRLPIAQAQRHRARGAASACTASARRR